MLIKSNIQNVLTNLVIINWGSFFYYKLGQVDLLQIRGGITNWGKVYYKLGQVLQIGAKFITNWGMYYKLEQLITNWGMYYKLEQIITSWGMYYKLEQIITNWGTTKLYQRHWLYPENHLLFLMKDNHYIHGTN